MAKHPKTTFAGVALILGAICSLAYSLLTGTPPEWEKVSGAVVAGMGLIAAADGSKLLVVLLLGVSLSGCGALLGGAGTHPADISCKGKGTITGSGHVNVNAGVGGQELNTFTLTADCGEGFEYHQGKVKVAPAPAPGVVK